MNRCDPFYAHVQFALDLTNEVQRKAEELKKVAAEESSDKISPCLRIALDDYASSMCDQLASMSVLISYMYHMDMDTLTRMREASSRVRRFRWALKLIGFPL